MQTSVATITQQAADRRRWIALLIVCLAQLMIVLDTTIVNVALPSIQSDLHFAQGNLTWVVDAYLISFGSFLLLAGRLGDLVGRKRVFLWGLTLFIAASAWCGVADSQGALIAGRFVQGMGGAFAASVILAIIVTEFPEGRDQARAMGLFTFVAVSGGSIGLLAGGWLTETVNWHWIFFVNVPIGLLALFAGRTRIDESDAIGLSAGVDVAGSILITAATMLGVYGVIEATRDGWTSTTTLGSAAIAVILLIAFAFHERRVTNPIVPLDILRQRGLMGSSVVRGLLATGMFCVFFLGALYLERVRGFGATDTGFAFLPLTLTVAALSLGVTPRLLGRYGPMRLIVFGLTSVLAALLVLSQMGAHTAYAPTMLVGFLLLGLGMGTAFMPLLTIAMHGIAKDEAGLASGIVNVSMQLSAAFGLAVLTTLSTNHTEALRASGESLTTSLVGGFQLAFYVAAACVATGLIVALVVLRDPAAAKDEAIEVTEREREPERELQAA